MTDTPAEQDGFVFHADGTVTVSLDDGPRRLRRPKLGQLRALREVRSRALDDVTNHSASVTAQLADLPLPSTRTDEERALVRKLSSDLTGHQEDAALSILRLIFDGGEHDGVPFVGLADRPLPDTDELPAWFADGRWDPIRQLLDHWQFAPPPRGAR